MKRFLLSLLVLFGLAVNAGAATTLTGDIITKGPWVDVRAFANYSVAVHNPSVVGKTLLVMSPVVHNGVTVPPGVHVRVLAPGLITNNGNLVFSTGATFSAPDNYQVFTGSGAVAGLSVVRVEWFGAKADNATNNAVAFNAASVASKTIQLSAGTYRFGSTWTLQSDTTIKGSNQYTSKLLYTGTGNAIDCSAGGYQQFYDFYLIGNVTSPSWFTAGTVGIYSAASPAIVNYVMYNVRVQNFEKLVTGNGYYWKFYQCTFMYCRNAFSSISSNNVLFDGCRLFGAEDIITSYGGAGPMVFIGTSFEGWSRYVLSPVSGGTLAASFVGCYFENYPETDLTGTGLTGNFKAAFVTAGKFRSLLFSGNMVEGKGIRRIINVSGVASAVVSEGNTFFVDTAAGASGTEFIYLIGTAGSTLVARDIIVPTTDPVDVGGTYTTANSTAGATVLLAGYNPITMKPFPPYTATLTATGMTTSPTGTVTYSIQGSSVTLNITSITGTSNATTFTLTGLPSICWPTGDRYVNVTIQDNGAARVMAVAKIDSAGVITLSKGLDGIVAFTASGTKSILGTSVSYPL